MKKINNFSKVLISMLLSILMIAGTTTSGFSAVVNSVVTTGDEEGVSVSVTKIEDTSGPDYPETSPACAIGIKAIRDDSTEVKIKDSGTIPYGTYTSFEVILTDGSKPTYAAFNNFYFKYIKVTMNSESSTKSFEYDSFTRSYNLLTNKTYTFNSDTTFSLEVEYSIPRYDLTFDANGGDGSYPKQNKYYGVGYTIPDGCFDSFTKDGCNLLGFSSSKSATTATYTKTNRTVTTNSQSQLNLKAVWEIDPANIFSVDIKFNDNVGKVKYNKTDITTDTTIAMNSVEFTNISAVDIPGYSFDRWECTGDLSFDEGQTVQSRTIDIKANSIGTITPIYTEATYTAIWQNYDGTKLGESTNLKLNDIPQYTGVTPTRPDESGFHYTFSNWNPSPSTGIKEDTTYVAQFSKTGITYQVSLDLCDGSAPQVIDVQFDASMPAIEPPTRSSYTFKGFYDQPNGQGTQYYYATGSSRRKYNKTEGCTLYAYWEGATYTVSIKSAGNGSVSPTSIKVNQDKSALVSATPANGYRFDTWALTGGAYLDESYSLTDSSVRLFANDTGTATASFTPLTYNIRYETNGGTINEQSYPTQYTVGTTVTFPTDVTIESGLVFGGWYKDSALTDGPVTSTTKSQYGDITLYAKWAEQGVRLNITTTENKESENYPESYSFYPEVVSCKCDGSLVTSGIPYGTHNLDFSITGSNLTSTSKKPFYIKSITINGEKTTYSDNKDSRTFSSYNVEQDLNVEIEFSIKNYKVTYKPNGAQGTAFYDIRYYDHPYTVLSCEGKFIYPGKHFDHYNTNQSDTGNTVHPGDIAPSNNNTTNFNAFWADDPPCFSLANVYAGLHGSVTIDDSTILKNQHSQVELSNVTPKEISCTPEEGYEFDHWEIIGGILVADPSSSTTTVTAILDGSITAIYREKTYNVVWRNCDGSVIAQTVGYQYGETPEYVGQTPTYSKTGYTYSFIGWTPDFHQIEGNQEYTAQYEITSKQYTVTLNLDGGTSDTSSVTATYGQILPEIDVVPTKDGFVFTGFYDQADGGTQYYSSDCVGIKEWDKDENSTLYAHWSVRGQKIYIEQDFSNCPPEVNEIDTRVILATGTSKKATDIVIDPINGTEITPGSEYYIFALFPNYPIGSTTVICSAETTISIEGKTISYSTSFNTYDGNKAYRSSSKYTFKGGEVIKIKYKWATQTMTLKQPSNQYSHGDPVTRYKYKGVAFTPPADVSSLGFYTDEGYYFTGYYWSSALHTLEYDENNSKAYISDSYTATAASLNMEARWAKLSTYDKEYRFTISFDTEPDTPFTPYQYELPEPLTDLALGQVVTLPEPTAPGCTFNGWYSKDDDVVVTDNRIMAQKDVTLYPSFTPNIYKVTFTSTDGVEGTCSYMGKHIDSNGVYLPGGESGRMLIKAPEGYYIKNTADITYNYEYIHFQYDKNRKQKDIVFCQSLVLHDDLDITVKFTKRNACELSFDSSEEFIQINDVVQFEATPNQNHTEEGVITYTSSNEEVATVDNNGVVTGLIPGETVITATCSDEESSPASYTLTVEEPQLSVDDLYIRFNEEYTLSSDLIIGAPQGGTASFSADPNSNVEVIDNTTVCTKEHAANAGKNQCYFTYSINDWTSEQIPFNVIVNSPALNPISDQVLQIGEHKSVNYSVNQYTRADSKVIDGIQYPYFEFLLDSGSDYFTVDDNNVVSTTDKALGGVVRNGYVTVKYYVNPTCSPYHTSYRVMTSQVKVKWKYDDSQMCLGDTKVIAAAFSPDLSQYGFVPEYKATTTSSSAAKVTIDKNTGELKYTRSGTSPFYANIHVDYKLPGTSQVIAQFDLNSKILLSGVSVSSQNNYKKHVFSSNEESGDIAELSLPQVSGDGVDDPDNYEFVYSIIEGAEYTELNGSEITPKASGLSKIKVSARLKDDPSCVTNSSYTFTVINDFGDTYDLDCIGYSACVDGDIKAYTVWTVPKEQRTDSAYVKYSYNKKLISKTYYVYFNDAEPDIQNNLLVYKFPCEIAAKEMSTDITYEFCSTSGEILKEGTFNLADDYIKPLIDSGSYYSNTVKKLINYGAYTQIQLGFNTEKLANEYLPDEDKELVDLNIVKENVNKFKATVSGESSGISYYGSSLVTESTLKVKQYFVVDNSVQTPPVCSIDGNMVIPQYAGKNSKGRIYYIQSSGCSIMNMDVMSEYNIGGLTITYCPLSYIYTVVNSTSAETPLGDANRALYDFYSTLNYYAGE